MEGPTSFLGKKPTCDSPLSESSNSKRLASGNVDQLVAGLGPLPQLLVRPCERPQLLPGGKLCKGKKKGGADGFLLVNTSLKNSACPDISWKPKGPPSISSDDIRGARASRFWSVARPDSVPTRSRWEWAHNLDTFKAMGLNNFYPSGEVRSIHKAVVAICRHLLHSRNIVSHPSSLIIEKIPN